MRSLFDGWCSEMALAHPVLSAQPEKILLINDRYYGVPALLVGLPASGDRHLLVRVKKNLKRRLLEVYPDGSALVEVASGQRTRLMREILGRVQRRAGGRLAQPPPRLCLRPSHQFDQPFEFRLSRVHC